MLRLPNLQISLYHHQAWVYHFQRFPDPISMPSMEVESKSILQPDATLYI